MSKNRYIKILLPSIALTFGSQAFAYTLQEAVSHTLATSPDFLIETNVRDEVDKQLRESYAGYLPTLDMSAGAGQQYSNNPTTRFTNPLTGPVTTEVGFPQGTRTETRTEFSLLASQMLFDGYAVYHDVEGHKARVRAESWRVNGTAQDVAMSTIEPYLNVLFKREVVRINRENVGRHESIFGQINKRSESGIGRKADLDQASSRVALARTNLLAEEANLRDAETEFLRHVGIKCPNHLSWPKRPHLPANEEVAIEEAIKNHPTLRASVEDVKVTREAHKGSKAPFAPRFDLQLEMSHNHNLDGTQGATNDAYAMVRMKWNLFNGGKDLAKICETAYKMQEAIEVENRALRQVVETLRLAWNIHITATRQMRYFTDHVDASGRTFEAYQKQFNIGQRTLLDLLDSQNEGLSASTALAEAKYKEHLGAFRILNAMGSLTDYFNIALPKQAEPRPTGLMDGGFRFFDQSAPIFD